MLIEGRFPVRINGSIFLHRIALLALLLASIADTALQAAEIRPPTGQASVTSSAAGAPAVASRHILVRVDSAAAEQRFLAAAATLGMHKLGQIYGSRWITVRLPGGADPRAMARRAASLPGASQATVDSIVTMLDHWVPNDPLYLPPPDVYCDPLIELCVDQWGLFDTGAEGAWHVTRGSASVVVAVLDSGLDLDHDDLYGNIWTNPNEIAGNGIDDDGNGIIDDVHGADFAGDNVGGFNDDPGSFDGSPDIPEGGQWVTDPATIWGIRWEGDPATGDADDNNLDGLPDLGVFHGTATAGVIAAMTNNLVPGTTDQYEGMAGVCGDCQLMAVRMINPEGNAFLSDAVSAVNYAVDMGATFINASWGLPIDGLGPSSPEIAPLVAAIDYAVANGVTIVAAAGNSGTQGVHFPATDPRVIAVGSYNVDRQISYFSSTAFPGEVPSNGIDDDGNGWTDDVIDVVAPGEGIWSTWVFAAYDSLLYQLLGDPSWPPGADTYSFADGTSFSAPLVTGYLALIRSQFPQATTAQLRSTLRDNADASIGLPGYDAESGFGRVQMVIPVDMPTSTNQAPVADISGDVNGVLTFNDTGKSGEQTVTVDGSSSSDPDGFIQSYSWSWSGSDGSGGAASGAAISVTLLVGPVYEFSLIVTDDQGTPSTADTVTVTVAPKSGGGGSGGGGNGGGHGNGGGPKNPKNQG
jgi:subtilisin family serine protease